MSSQSRTELIAHLKDQLQEMKAKTNMEGKYVRKNTELQVWQTQQMCTIAETDVQQEIQVSAAAVFMYTQALSTTYPVHDSVTCNRSHRASCKHTCVDTS